MQLFVYTLLSYFCRTRKDEGSIRHMSKGLFNLERKSRRNVENILLENQYFCHEVFDLTTILHTENCGKLQMKIISRQRKMVFQKNLLKRKYIVIFFLESFEYIFHNRFFFSWAIFKIILLKKDLLIYFTSLFGLRFWATVIIFHDNFS